MGKRIAIMQPYIFPYIGYWQLIYAVDLFVVYNDVNFIKRGWIHRNQLLVSGKGHMFTIPLEKSSQNKEIQEIKLSEEEKWKDKLLKTISLSYKKAPNFNDCFSLIEEIINFPENNLSLYIENQIKKVCDYLGIETEIVSSIKYSNKNLKAQERILDICKREKADEYINPIGGQELYNKEFFENENIKLSFLKSEKQVYKQFKNEFIPWLSIIDVMMFNSKDEINKMLNSYQRI